MPRKFRPTTPGMRQLVLPTKDELTRPKPGRRAEARPLKRLLKFKKSTGGRNNQGRLTCRHKGGGHKRFYRVVDFKRDKFDIPAMVASIEYDPNRSGHIALLHYKDGEKRYIVAPNGLKKGDQVVTTDKPPYRNGNYMKMKHIPLGSFIHCIEMIPGKGGKLIRSAGLGAQLMARSDGMATIKMPSGEVRMLNENCRAALGTVSNAEHSLRVEGKAGRKRWKGIRPTVRGTAMNPVDHPHGGGEGRHNGYIPQSPWAMQTKGFKTRKKRKVGSRFIVKDRRKK